jgi:phytoene desaturase
MAKHIVVIGAGFGGLSAAALLAHRGWKVTVVEKNQETGGRARLWKKDGFTFDMGPSWYLMPEVFDRYFGVLGEKREDYYALKKLDPYYRVFFGSDSLTSQTVDITPDLKGTLEMFEGFEPGGAARLRRYLDLSKYKYDTAMNEFLYREYRSIFDFFTRKMMVEGLRLDIFRGLDSYVSRYFTDHRAKKLLEYAMVFLGTGPREAPGLYSIMSHVDMNLGVTFPDGGLGGVALAFERLARSRGVEFLTGCEVTSVITRNGKACGVKTSEGEIPSDAVLSGADYHHVESDLLSEGERSYSARYWKRRVVAPSMFLIYLGIGKPLPSFEHHNLYFTDDWDRHFRTIFDEPAWPDDPCFYLSCITKTDRTMAPPGMENVFILVPVAPGLTDSDDVREEYAELVLRHVEKVGGESLRDSVKVKRIYSHRDFIGDYNAYRGTALGLAHTLTQTAVFRPSHRSRKVKNLYFTGQYTHPGVGVPMVLIASEVAADVIGKDFS